MATIKFKLDGEKIYLHYRQGKKEFQFYTPHSCKKENWDGDSIKKIKGVDVPVKGKYRMKGNSTEAIHVNSYLDTLESTLKDILSEIKILCLSEKREIDFYQIKNKFIEKYAPEKNEKNIIPIQKDFTLIDLFSKYIEIKSHQLNDATLRIFRRVQRHLMEFSKKENLTLSINDVNLDFYINYQKYLIDIHQYMNSTINMEIKKVKEVSNFYKDEYPTLFVPSSKLKRMPEPDEQRFTMSYQESELFYQTAFENEKIEIDGKSLSISKNSLEIVKDCYIFSFNTGIPYEPLCTLTELSISSVEIFEEKVIYKLGNLSFEDSQSLMGFLIKNKNQLGSDSTDISYENKISKKNIPIIQYHRDKNKKILVTPLNQRCIEIIEKYRGKQKRLLPMMTNQKMNFYGHIALKQSKIFNDEVTQVNYRGKETITKIMPRYEAITFHSARHGFASYLLNSGLPISFIQKLLGHSDLKTTQIYAKANAHDVIKQAYNLLK